MVVPLGVFSHRPAPCACALLTDTAIGLSSSVEATQGGTATVDGTVYGRDSTARRSDVRRQKETSPDCRATNRQPDHHQGMRVIYIFIYLSLYIYIYECVGLCAEEGKYERLVQGKFGGGSHYSLCSAV